MENNTTDIEVLALQLKTRSPTVQVVEFSMLILIILITIVGNLAVLTILYKTPSLRTMASLFIASLAVSDLALPILCSSFSAAVLIFGYWPFGEFLCQFQSFGVLVLACASLQTMALTAVNRYFCIVRPMYYRQIFTARRTKLMITAVWILACTEPVPYLISGKRYKFHPGKFFCFQGKEISFESLLVYAYITFPMVIIFFCYFNVFWTLHQHQKVVVQKLNGGKAKAGGLKPSIEEIKATKTLFLTVVGFVAVWTPVTVVDFIDFANGHWILPRQVYVMYTFLGTASSTLNPFIYGMTNRNFRKEYKKLFRLGGQLSTSSPNTNGSKVHPLELAQNKRKYDKPQTQATTSEQG